MAVLIALLMSLFFAAFDFMFAVVILLIVGATTIEVFTVAAVTIFTVLTVEFARLQRGNAVSGATREF
jgi:hypothetical protein